LLNEPSETPIAFANIRGTLGDVLARIESRELIPMGPTVSGSPYVNPPLRQQFLLRDLSAWILRDTQGRPLRIGTSILIQQRGRTVLLDTSAKTTSEALRFGLPTGPQKVPVGSKSSNNRIFNPSSQTTGTLIAGKTTDEKVFVVADGKQLAGFDLGGKKVLWRRPFSELKLNSSRGQSQIIGTGEGLLLLASRQGRLVAVNMTDGKVAWESQLQGISKNQYVHVQVSAVFGSGLVGIRYSHGRNISVFDTASGKLKLSRTFTPKRNTGAYPNSLAFSPSGMLVMTFNGELSIWDPKRLDKPLKTRKYNTKELLGILAVNETHVLIAQRTKNSVEAVSIEDPGKTFTMSCSPKIPSNNKSKVTDFPVRAFFDGPSVYLFCTRARSRSIGPTWEKDMFQGLSICKFDLSEKKRVWRKEMISNQSISVVNPVFSKDHLALVTRRRAVSSSTRKLQLSSWCWVLDTSDGSQVQKINLSATTHPNPAMDQRFHQLGGVVFTNGQLAVETVEGIGIYGGD